MEKQKIEEVRELMKEAAKLRAEESKLLGKAWSLIERLVFDAKE